MKNRNVDIQNNVAKIATKNKKECICVDNDNELIDIIGNLMRTKVVAEIAAMLFLKWEGIEIVKIAKDIADKIIDIDRTDVEYGHGGDSLRYLVDKKLDERLLDDEISQTIYDVFDFCFLYIATDVDYVFDNIYLGSLENQAVGISTIAEGISDGAKLVIKYKDDNDDGYDGDYDDDGGNDDSTNKVVQLEA